MWEVIEHLTAPATVLRRLREALPDGGLLALSTPSASGIPARFMGSRFPMLTAPEHLVVFSREGLDTLLRTAGFEPISWRSFSGLDSDTFGRALQRRLGQGPTWFLGGLARLGSWTATAIDAAGLGTSFEVYARRR
jgi:hypothetical protein